MLTQEQREAIRADTGLYTDIAERHDVHKSTVSRIKSGKYFKLKCSPAVGGHMVRPGCGRADYGYTGVHRQVVCRCGWVGDYDDMLFVKKMSPNGRRRSEEYIA